MMYLNICCHEKIVTDCTFKTFFKEIALIKLNIILADKTFVNSQERSFI
jgi:hypothetical protein